LVVFGLLDVAALGRRLVRHGILRAIDARQSEENGQDTPLCESFTATSPPGLRLFVELIRASSRNKTPNLI